MLKSYIAGTCGLFFLMMGIGEAEELAKINEEGLQMPRVIRVLKQDDKPVKITGQVQKPGKLLYVKGLTLGEAIKKAGGYTNLANLRNVTLTREGKVMKLDMRDPKKKNEDLKLLPGDVIVIGERFF